MKHSTNAAPISPTSSAGQVRFFKDLFSTQLGRRPAKSIQLEVDTHGHWLPGVDDGAQTTEDGLALVKGLSKLGYRKLIATPHIMTNHYGNHPEKLTRAFGQFKKVVRLAGIEVELGLAAEYRLDDGFAKHMEDGPLLTLKDGLVLLEMSFFQAFPALMDVLFELQIRGYQPVLAHPERYGYYYRNWSAFEELKDAGCLFQLNILSLAGHYGKRVEETARKLMKYDWYEFAGTDIHRVQHLKKLANVLLPLPFSNSKLL